LLCAVSTILLNHAFLPWGGETRSTVRSESKSLQVPAEEDALQQARQVLQQLSLSGEIQFAQRDQKRLFMLVEKPGCEMDVTVDLQTQTATIQRKHTGLWDGVRYLHTMPGPHNAKIRGNWLYMQAWSWLADASVYLLLFVWLFAVSGLLLNHPKWQFASFWPQRRLSSFERTIQAPSAAEDLTMGRDLMRQLELHGEIQWPEKRPTAEQFVFHVHHPGQRFEVKANLATGQAAVQRTRVNLWGVLSDLHHLTGVQMKNPNQQRDWWLTWVWSIAMDAVALGLIFLVVSGLLMWLPPRGKRAPGIVALSLGTLTCGFLVVLLGRIL
jgi:hypothetical protein